MKMLCFILAMTASVSLSAQSVSAPPIGDLLKVKWKTNIGLTTYRTNIMLYGDKILVGSNGKNIRDYALDAGNGLYMLNAATGKQALHLEHENLGDMDVNGVAVDGNRIYFGSDNDEMHCYSLSGEKIWSVPVSGDVEVKPLLIDVNKDGIKDALFATEGGEVAVLNGVDGKHVWSFKIKDFNGWKKTQNRYVFKVGDWFRNGVGFMAAPVMLHINDDGVLDVVATARDGFAYALDGSSGKLLWRYKHDTYASQSPLLHYIKGVPRIYMQASLKENDTWVQKLVCLNTQGEVAFASKGMSGFSEVIDPLVVGNEVVYCSYDSVHVFNLLNGDKRSGRMSHPKGERRYYEYSSQPVLMDLLGLGSPQLSFIDQGGALVLLDWKSLARLREFTLPSGSETSPLLADVDCDGRLEMLVSAYDGYLYCFATGISEKAWVRR